VISLPSIQGRIVVLACPPQLEIYDYRGGYAQRFDGIDRNGAARSQDLQNIFVCRVSRSMKNFYCAMAAWGQIFNCPVLVHSADKKWVVDPDPSLEFWAGETRDVLPGITLHRLGGHFPGSAILHWADRRTLLSGDTMLVTPDLKHVSFMWSYPNNVPLPPTEVERIGRRLKALEFDSIYSAFWERGDIHRDAQEAVERSIVRHIEGPKE
jgi:hypothetical protein